MKWFTFKTAPFLFILMIAGSLEIKAQDRYEKKIERYQSTWKKLIPTHSKLQYAGDMGLVSLGIGWDYGKRNQWETDVLLGFLPKYSSDKVKFTFTLKQNYIPWNLPLKNNFSIDPLACGMYLNTVFDDDFWTKEPDRYPKGYYGFSSKVRIHLFLGQRVTYQISNKHFWAAKSATLFYEISTCDMYVISAFGNGYLKPKDYLRLSFGIKVQLF